MSTSVYDKFLDEILGKLGVAIPDEQTKNLAEQIAKYELSDHFSGNQELKRIQIEVFQRTSFQSRYKGMADDVQIVPEDVDLAARIVKTGSELLVTAIHLENLKGMLGAFSVLCYFGLPYLQVVDFASIPYSKIESLKVMLQRVLTNFDSKPGVPLSAPYHERRFVEEYDKAIVSGDIMVAYELVIALDRGMGIVPEPVIREMIRLLLGMDETSYCKALDAQKTPLGWAFLLEPISIEDKLRIGAAYGFSSPWVLFEIIRQSIGRVQGEKLSDKSLEEMSSCLERIGTKDGQLFLHSSRSFAQSLDFAGAFGMALARVDQQLFKDYLDTIRIEQFHSPDGIALVNRQFEAFHGLGTAARADKYLGVVHEKWEKFVEDSMTGKEVHLTQMFYSNHCDVVLCYLCNPKNSRAELVPLLLRSVKCLNRLHTYWFQTQAQLNSRLWGELSRLYLYSIAWKACGLECYIDEELHRELKRFLNDGRWMVEFFGGGSVPEVAKEISENFRLLIHWGPPKS